MRKLVTKQANQISSFTSTPVQIPKLPRVSGVLLGCAVATRLCVIVLDVLVFPLICLVFAVNLFQLCRDEML